MARREYSEEFRRDAVKQVIENGYGIIETAERLGVHCWDAKNLATECIHTWPADAL